MGRCIHALEIIHPKKSRYDLLTPPQCPICGNTTEPDTQAHAELALGDAPKTYTILRCLECGLRYMTPYPTLDDYQTIYDHDYYESEQEGGNYRKEKQELIPCYSSIAQRFRSFKTNRLLDIGCGTGDFLLVAKENGIYGEGVEPSSYAANKASEASLLVFQGTLSDLPPNTKAYTGVYCSHVLEHVPDAHAFIEEIRSILEPNAPLYLEVPIQFDGILDILNRLFNRRRGYSDLSIHHHYFFTPKAITQLLEAHNFEIVTLTTFMSCRRTLRKPGLRKWALQSLLWVANNFNKRSDVISIWARQKG